MTDPYSLEKAKAYQKKREGVRLFELFYTPALLVGMLVFPVSQNLKVAAAGITTQPYGFVAVYFAFYSLLMLLMDGPVAFYTGYKLEKKFELSNHTPASWLADFLKRTVLSFVLSVALIEALYGLIWHSPNHWWIFAWAGFAGVSYILGKVFPVYIVPLFYKYGKVEDESMKKRIFDLAKHYGLPVENVYSINLSRTTKKANAAFMGMGKTKRVVLSDTLLSNFTPDEIIAVVAHELGHFKHKDIWKSLGLGLVSSFAGFWIVFQVLDPAARVLGFEGVGDVGALPLVFLIFFVLHLLMMPLQNGFSRMLERAADRFALSAFPNKEAFISCMDKLSKVNLADPEPHPFVEWLFYDHPAINKRIKMAQAWKN